MSLLLSIVAQRNKNKTVRFVTLPRSVFGFVLFYFFVLFCVSLLPQQSKEDVDRSVVVGFRPTRIKTRRPWRIIMALWRRYYFSCFVLFWTQHLMPTPLQGWSLSTFACSCVSSETQDLQWQNFLVLSQSGEHTLMQGGRRANKKQQGINP